MKLYEPDWTNKEMKEAKEKFVLLPGDNQYYNAKEVDERDSRVLIALMDIAAKAKFELANPTGIYQTCLSLIEKAATKAQEEFLDNEAKWTDFLSEPKEGECRHEKCTPQYDEKQMEADALTMDTSTFRAKYPRFDGYCPECKSQLIAYASFMHYVMGDW